MTVNYSLVLCDVRLRDLLISKSADNVKSAKPLRIIIIITFIISSGGGSIFITISLIINSLN